NASAATLRQRQSRSRASSAAAATPAALSAWARAMPAWRRKAKRGLASRASSWAAARAPPSAPRVVSAWTATFTSRSATSGSARPTSPLSWNEASARSALTRTWPSRSPSSGRMRAITSGGAIWALSLKARVTPRSATARTYGSRSASAPSRVGTARAMRKRASAYTAWARAAGSGSRAKSVKRATGARVPRRHASSSATRCTADVPTPAAAFTSSRSATARAPASPPIFARAVTASHCGAPSPARASAASSTQELQANRVRCLLEQVEYMRGKVRERVLVGERDERRHPGRQQLAARRAVDRIAEGDAPRGQLAHPAAHPHQIVVARRGAEAKVDLGHREVHALLLQLFVGDAGLAHQLGAGTVEPDQVVGV